MDHRETKQPSSDDEDKRRFGYSRDKRGDCVQVVIALVVTPQGFPLAYEVLPGKRFEDSVSIYRLAAFITAPSMMTPAVTYFQSATSSFRASATMVVFLRRPPFRLTRSSNHRAGTDCG